MGEMLFFCYTIFMFLMIFLIFMLLVSIVLVVVITSAFLGFVFTRVPFVPTSKADVEFFVKKLALGPKDMVYDLGSGDGKVVFLVNKLSGASAVGFEMTWWTHLLAKAKLKINDLRFKKKHPITFKNKNFFKANWSEATVIYGYLFPPLMAKVEEKFLAECKPGTFAVIRDFPFPNLRPLEIIYRPKSHELYIYLK